MLLIISPSFCFTVPPCGFDHEELNKQSMRLLAENRAIALQNEALAAQNVTLRANATTLKNNYTQAKAAYEERHSLLLMQRDKILELETLVKSQNGVMAVMEKRSQEHQSARDATKKYLDRIKAQNTEILDLKNEIAQLKARSDSYLSSQDTIVSSAREDLRCEFEEMYNVKIGEYHESQDRLRCEQVRLCSENEKQRVQIQDLQVALDRASEKIMENEPVIKLGKEKCDEATKREELATRRALDAEAQNQELRQMIGRIQIERATCLSEQKSREELERAFKALSLEVCGGKKNSANLQGEIRELKKQNHELDRGLKNLQARYKAQSKELGDFKGWRYQFYKDDYKNRMKHIDNTVRCHAYMGRIDRLWINFLQDRDIHKFFASHYILMVCYQDKMDLDHFVNYGHRESYLESLKKFLGSTDIFDSESRDAIMSCAEDYFCNQIVVSHFESSMFESDDNSDDDDVKVLLEKASFKRLRN